MLRGSKSQTLECRWPNAPEVVPPLTVRVWWPASLPPGRGFLYACPSKSATLLRRAAGTKQHRLVACTWTLTSHGSGDVKSKVKVPADSVPGEDCLPGLQRLAGSSRGGRGRESATSLVSLL